MRTPYKAGNIKDDGVLLAFFDFYVLNEVWFKTVGMEDCGYATTKILPFKKERVIRETFEEKVTLLKEEVVRALEYSVRREIEHWWHHAGNCQYNDRTKRIRYEALNKRYGFRWGCDFTRTSLETVKEMFLTRCWAIQYGGKKWATATDFLIKLKASKTLKDDVYLIDRIFDLQHNTGHLLNKTNFRVLSRPRSFSHRRSLCTPLTFRFKASVDELAKYCSNLIYGIYRANLNYIQAAA